MKTTRTLWINQLQKTAGPVFEALATGQLKATMPIEHHPRSLNRANFTHLEAVGRSLSGIAPWLELSEGHPEEQALRECFRGWVRQGLGRAVMPDSPDRIDFSAGDQILVDAAFLAQGLLRCWTRVWLKIEPSVQQEIINSMIKTRQVSPGFNNWLLFSAMVEAFLFKAGADGDQMRIDYALRQHEQWYKGDGIYGDGPEFHFDYYNSFVIQPFLVDILSVGGHIFERWSSLTDKILQRAKRFAEIQEGMIAPDGSFPAVGRSLCYRFGVFHHLALMALRHELPDETTPAAVRCALTACLQRTMTAAGTFDNQGWLQIGLCGHQPSLGESYISTGSLYLCCSGFLPLGLPATDPFWSDPDEDWTNKKIWDGTDFPARKAYREI